ncbi:MAG: dihydrofolate synthase/folylpolyglutamate synthase [Cryomorphaceae bacterium]|jgi:dihydrofolate synthase/folylpolyglutamate synthase
MSERSLSEWVDYIQTLHYREIELSLERVREVYLRLYPESISYPVITIAGTNGKGSTAEMLASVLRSANYRVGKFTSPHLVDFKERYNIDGKDVDDNALLASFKKIEAARASIPITFFEFGTLLAIDLFAVAEVDVAIMEVGLGGRLDAINILDADVSVITSIAIDHTAWLGDTIEKIAREKVGVARAAKPCVVGITNPPVAIQSHCADIGAPMLNLGAQFSYRHEPQSDVWDWVAGGASFAALPLPFGQAGVQLSNASCALMALMQLKACLPVTVSDVRQGLHNAQLLARCQVLQSEPTVILDVAHNESSAMRLNEFVQDLNCQGRVLAVVGMLQDKEIGVSLRLLASTVDEWHFATIHAERGAKAGFVAAQLAAQSGLESLNVSNTYNHVESAFNAAFNALKSDDLLLVFGSFYIAGDILAHVRARGLVG